MLTDEWTVGVMALFFNNRSVRVCAQKNKLSTPYEEESKTNSKHKKENDDEESRRVLIKYSLWQAAPHVFGEMKGRDSNPPPPPRDKVH